jgi:DNA-directed RNA polymerase specialized sigma24 family protein
MAKAGKPNGENSATLGDVVERLDALIYLLLPHADSALAQVSDLQQEVLSLCDYEHTTEDISSITKKSANHINKELSLLRSKGVVKTISRGSRKVHVRLAPPPAAKK